MPYTLAHPIAVAPLSRRLPAAALVAGAMSPDAAYFVMLRPGHGGSHTPAGLFTHCLPAGLLAFTVWRLWMKPRLADFFGTGRIGGSGEAPRRFVFHAAVAVVAVLIGASTHLLWDATSHADGWVVQRVPWFRSTQFGRPIFKWNQYVSGVLGTLACAAWFVHWATARRVRVIPPGRVAAFAAGWAAAAVVVTTASFLVHGPCTPAEAVVRGSIAFGTGLAVVMIAVATAASRGLLVRTRP